MIATGLLGVGLPVASAHTANLNVSAQCQDDGTRLVTYNGTTTNVPGSGPGHTATLTVDQILPTGTQVSPTTQTVAGNTTFSFTQTVSGSASGASATAYLVWGDNAKSTRTGSTTFSADCQPVVPAKPAPVVVVTPSEAKDCDARTVTTTTVTTTTDWVLVDNVWVKGEPTSTQEVTSRAATTQECPIIVPAKPAPVVVVTASQAKDCDARTVTTTTVTTTTGWVLVDNVWVKGEPTSTQEVTSRAATAQECPIIVPDAPAPTPAPVIAPRPVVEAPVLVAGVQAVANPLPMGAAAGQADTSDSLIAGGLAGFAAFLALSAGFVLRRRHGDV